VLDLREYRRRPARLADYLPWVALVAPGVVLNKDGGFQRTAEFRGPDLAKRRALRDPLFPDPDLPAARRAARAS
jgi:type IV secretory pathway VirB4 component